MGQRQEDPESLLVGQLGQKEKWFSERSCFKVISQRGIKTMFCSVLHMTTKIPAYLPACIKYTYPIPTSQTHTHVLMLVCTL